MELKITGLAGDVICVVNVTPSLERVSDLKEEICRVSKISPKLQKLLLGDAILNNSDRLQEVLQHSEAQEIQLIRFDKWSEEVALNWKRLRKASEAVRNDRDLVMAAMDASEGEAIKFAGEDVRADREIMLAAMKFDRSLCRYARGELHTDRSFLLAALDTPGFFPRFSGWLRWQASPELCADYDFLLKILAKDGASFRVVQEDLRSNPTLATVAIQNSPSAFRFAGDVLKGDPTVAGLAARLDPLNLEFVAENLKADRAFVLEALEAAPVRHVRPWGGYSNSILKHLPLPLRSDLEVVSKALAYISPYCLSKELDYVSNELKNHPEIRKLHPYGPYRCDVQPVRCRPMKSKKTAKDEEEDISQLHLSQEARNYLMHADYATQQLPSFWSELVKIDPLALRCLSEDARQNRQLVMTAVKKCGLALQYASAELKEDREVVKVALKESRWAYDYIPESLRLDREIAVLAFRLHQMKLPKQLLNDKDAVVAAAEIAARRAENPGELSKKKLHRMSIANLIAEYELA